MRPRRITPFLDLHSSSYDAKTEFNNVLLFIKNNSQFKNMAKTFLPPSIHLPYAQCTLGLFSSVNILQIVDVALRVVFLLFLPCFFKQLFRLVLTLKTNEMSAIFIFTAKTTQPRPQVFSVNKLQKSYTFDVIGSLNAKFLQIWSSVACYGELCVCFQPMRIGETRGAACSKISVP